MTEPSPLPPAEQRCLECPRAHGVLSISPEPLCDVVEVLERVHGVGQHLHPETAVTRSEARFRTLVEDQSELVSLGHPDGVLTFVNAAYAAHFGRRIGDLIGSNLFDLVAPVDRPAVIACLRAVCETGGTAAVESRTVAADGSVHYVAWTSRAVTDAAGHTVEVHSVGRDVTALKAAESALRASEQKFKLLSEASPLGVFHADVGGACTYANAQWQGIYGLSSEQTIGDHWLHRLHPDDRDRVLAEYRRGLAAGDEFGWEFRVLRPDGERLVHARARALIAADGTVQGCVGVVEDVTERRQAIERLRVSEALLAHTGRIAGVGGWALDLHSSRVSWSAQTYRIHEVPDGYEPTLEAASASMPRRHGR